MSASLKRKRNSSDKATTVLMLCFQLLVATALRVFLTVQHICLTSFHATSHILDVQGAK